MGREVPSTSSFDTAWRSRGVTSKKKTHVTATAERQAHATNQLSPVVDPAHDPIRRSLMRFDPIELPDGRRAWVVTVGVPWPVEDNVDTTGSMGDNVDRTAEHMPESITMLQRVLPGRDPQFAAGYFGDVTDKFPFQRGQFEMTAEKLVNTLTNMVPERDGGDDTEDPHYGIFGAAYLTDAYIHRIGLKGYHFTVSDAPTRIYYSLSTLQRIFGNDVLEKVAENGRFTAVPPTQGDLAEQVRAIAREIHQLSLNDVVQDLLRTTHAFFFHVVTYHHPEPAAEWLEAYGNERVIKISSTEWLPQAQAAVVGLTEGALNLQNVQEFLTDNGMPNDKAKQLVRELRKIPIGAQEKLIAELKHPLPKAGDIFESKTDLWPIMTIEDVVRAKAETENGQKNTEEKVGWL